MLSETMDSVFQALAHADRRRILDVVRATPGCSVNEVSGHFSTSRIAVMKHLRLLEEAGLVNSEKVGRTRRLYVNATPIQMIHDRWVSGYVQFWAEKLLDIKYAVERGESSSGEASTGEAGAEGTSGGSGGKGGRGGRGTRAGGAAGASKPKKGTRHGKRDGD